MLRLQDYPALVLNADYRPLSTAPISTWSWQDAIKAAVEDRVAVLAEHDVVVRSPSRAMRLPSVVALRDYVSLHRPASFSRWNVLVAFGGRCNYCGERLRHDDFTFEHVVPQSRGGGTGWHNVCPACVPCNSRKKARTPAEAGMPLLRPLYHPTLEDLHRAGTEMPVSRQDVPRSWLDFLYWYSELEP
jgi:5-methylcytosine-specific restriction endonuclease McrA